MPRSERAGRSRARGRGLALLLVGLALLAIGLDAPSLLRWLGRLYYPYPYRAQIEQQARAYRLDPLFVVAVIREESRFRPRARSAVGARGLMQLMPGTARWIVWRSGIRVHGAYSEAALEDPDTNIALGCWYLSYLFRKFHDPAMVLAAYNGGEGNESRWSRLVAPPYPETRRYVARGMRVYHCYQWLYGTGTGGCWP